MGLDWPYPAERSKQHHSPVPDLEPTREEKERRTQKQLKRNTDKELRVMGYTWKEVVRKAQVRVRWRSVVNDLCSTWSDGPK